MTMFYRVEKKIRTFEEIHPGGLSVMGLPGSRTLAPPPQLPRCIHRVHNMSGIGRATGTVGKPRQDSTDWADGRRCSCL